MLYSGFSSTSAKRVSTASRSVLFIVLTPWSVVFSRESTQVLVEYEYDALHDDELTLRPGEIIKNELKKESKEVKETKTEPKEEASLPLRREKSAGNVANLVQRMSTIGIPTGGFLPQPPAASKKPKRRQCKSLFDYQPQNEDELELKIGDIVDITEEVEEGWWSGNANGKSGLFPSNFVKELDASGEEGESNDTAAEEIDGSGMESGSTPTSPQPASGNGVVAQPKKIRGVGFGDIFKEGSVKLKARLPSPDIEERKGRPIPSLPSAAKPAHPNMTDSQRADDNKSKAKEYCKVTFAFEGTNEDELTIKEGETLHILSKDTGEPGWWRGEIGGREGVFPDNFVTMVSDAEKETPTSRGSVRSSPKQEPEEKPKKPPPPSKSIVDKPTLEHKPSKPAAPVVPPKKPVPPPGKGRPGSLPPKRPDKPLAPSPKHNGEVPSTRPKSEFEPSLPTKPKTLSGDWGEKSSDETDKKRRAYDGVKTRCRDMGLRYGIQYPSSFRVTHDGNSHLFTSPADI
ncbi:hypothetical protein F7725_019206 [Dissostichus mawsoni]|uniref:Osteoclast-stimulating factor 1 n=1 Tax=Dissostichus mawsoni TaxID=36200 RepID=A0A7J5YM47_DISMA|nr:hypothetical protein F7725_019206 [Dissostichus mawsoni]